MGTAFSITTTTNAISLDAEGKALALFTVNNQTGRSVRVRTTVSPFEPTPADWFTIEGETERLYPPGGSEAVRVRVATGVNPPPGRYAFRLDAVASDRPDEDWEHGPAVGFEVLAPPDPKPVEKPTGYIETVLGALVGALLAGLVGAITSVIMLVIVFDGNMPLVAVFLRLVLVGPLSLGCALGGTLGAVGALVWRSIPDGVWRTGIAFGSLATLVLTIVQIAITKAIPLVPVDAVPFVVMVVVTLIFVVLLGLAARAIGRYLSVGKL